MVESYNREEVINPNTILWLLKIIVKFRSNKILCLNAAKTLLDVVSNHTIVFDYQEDAIIKKFNVALQNLEYEGSTDLEYKNEALQINKKETDIKGSSAPQKKEEIKLETVPEIGHTSTNEPLEFKKIVSASRAKDRRLTSNFNNNLTTSLLRNKTIREESLAGPVKTKRVSSSSNVAGVINSSGKSLNEMNDDELMENEIND